MDEIEAQKDTHSVVNELLEEFSNVFHKPKGLPPKKRHDHKIPLKDKDSTVSSKPYRMPQNQKTEIERQVKEILKDGIIQHSNLPFVALILLVCKKDGSWRQCVDYQRLNELTIKDKLPIPVIEEFLDELNGGKEIY